MENYDLEDLEFTGVVAEIIQAESGKISFVTHEISEENDERKE